MIRSDVKYISFLSKIQFGSDANHLEIRFHKFKGMVPNKTTLILDVSYKFLGSPDHSHS